MIGFDCFGTPWQGVYPRCTSLVSDVFQFGVRLALGARPRAAICSSSSTLCHLSGYDGRVILRWRQDRIITAMQCTGAVSVRELAEALDVSEATIRRDLQTLDANGELSRTYGG